MVKRFTVLHGQGHRAFLCSFEVHQPAKAEGLGIALMASLEGSDPSALVGLPLIELTTLLDAAGCPVL